MQANVKTLSKKAINAALKNDWQAAVDYNKQILEKSPNDINAKTRLGRAYMQTKEFTKAKKIFEEVLEKDPINSIARKNLKLASEKKALGNGNGIKNHTKALIKEPGTTTEVKLEISPKAAEQLEPGQELDLRIAKTKLTFLIKDQKKELGVAEGKVAQTVYQAHEDELKVSANVATINENGITILLKCKKPIFKAQKQQETPYVKKGLIEEPELEIPDHADADTDEE